MRTLRRSSLAFALALAAGAGVPAAAAAADASGGFSARPAEFDPHNPSTRAYFQPTVGPGAGFSGGVVLTNPGGAPKRLTVYAVDGLTGATSGAVYSNSGAALRGAGRWVTPALSTITLPPHGERTVPFTVRVPRTASPGDHLAGIAFEAAPLASNGGQFAITEVLRVVIGIEIRVPGPAWRQLVVPNASVQRGPGAGTSELIVALGDTGGLLCEPQLSVSLRGAGRVQHLARTLEAVLPGDQISYPVPLSSNPKPGDYHLLIAAKGCGRPVSLDRELTVGPNLAAPPPHAPTTSSSAHASRRDTWVIDVLVLLAVVGLLGVALGVRLGRRGNSKPLSPEGRA